MAIRTEPITAALAPSVERAIWSVDPTPPLVRVRTMKELVAASQTQRSFALVVFAAFALTAVVLAVVGLYGVWRERRGARARARHTRGARRVAAARWSARRPAGRRSPRSEYCSAHSVPRA